MPWLELISYGYLKVQILVIYDFIENNVPVNSNLIVGDIHSLPAAAGGESG